MMGVVRLIRSAPLIPAGLMLAATAGCGSFVPKRLVPPTVEPRAVLAAIMKTADEDTNGSVERHEIVRIPGLASAREFLDTDSSGSLSAAEIKSWLDAVKDSRVAIVSLTVGVHQKGKPLADVSVRLVPEPCMGNGPTIAEGRTDATGNATVSIPGSRYAGVNCGIYRVEIAGTGADGMPLPARYNSASELGAAVGGPLPRGGAVMFNLE